MPLNKIPQLRDPTKRDFVHEVKDLFLQEYKREPDLYYAEDVRQVEELQFLLLRCIINKRKNVKESLNSLIATLRWRKELRLRELTDQDFFIENFQCGAVFTYEPDKYGNKTLYIRTQFVRNIPELKSSFKHFLAYKMYQVDDSVNGNTWSVILDLTNTGFSNYDIDLLLYLLNLLREYFPVNMDYVLAINFPWVLTTAWVLAKRLIPPERRDVVSFISHKEVFNYIDKENLPDFLGGECQREHVLSPKGCPSIVDFLFSQRDPEIQQKRIQEIIKIFGETLSKEHVEAMMKKFEEKSR